MAQRKNRNPGQPSWLERIITTFTRARRTLRNLTDATDHAAKFFQKLQAAWGEWIPATDHRGDFRRT
ncbi:hypothetical protein [Streptomyces parvus]|uniref:hypothetical protein n=1 Tax=Streptomyces parvus TaxID=66428 RepID=UPI0033CA8421